MTGPPKMKSLVVLIGLMGAGVCWPLQPVQDTPEVAAAKAAHLAALAKAKQAALAKSKPTTQPSWNVEENTIKQEPWTNQWAGNVAQQDQWNQVNDASQAEDDGSWKDDESWKNYDDGSWRESDVTEAPKPENKWANVGEPSKWKGPIALPPGYDESGAPLPVEDTPEVAAAKAKHLQAYLRAATKTAPAAQSVPVSNGPVPASQPALPNSLVRPALQNPLVRPPLQNSLARPALPKTPLARPSLIRPTPRVIPKEPAPIYENEGVLDTPEVAAAKARHFAAHAKLRLRQ